MPSRHTPARRRSSVPHGCTTPLQLPAARRGRTLHVLSVPLPLRDAHPHAAAAAAPSRTSARRRSTASASAARPHDTTAAPSRTPRPLAPRAERRLCCIAVHARTPPPPLAPCAAPGPGACRCRADGEHADAARTGRSMHSISAAKQSCPVRIGRTGTSSGIGGAACSGMQSRRRGAGRRRSASRHTPTRPRDRRGRRSGSGLSRTRPCAGRRRLRGAAAALAPVVLVLKLGGQLVAVAMDDGAAAIGWKATNQRRLYVKEANMERSKYVEAEAIKETLGIKQGNVWNKARK